MFSLEGNLQCAAALGALAATLPESGARTARFAPESQVSAAVAEQNAISDDAGLSVAAYNGAH